MQVIETDGVDCLKHVPSFGDQSRMQVIETRRSWRGTRRRTFGDQSRMQVIETLQDLHFTIQLGLEIRAECR